MNVIVGGVIEKDGKILLVQEAKEKCYGRWNIPAGHLDCNETIEQGAIREIKEETGCDVKLTGVASITNKVSENDILVTIIFVAKLINETIRYDKNEILDVGWFRKEDILHNMDDKLRDVNFVKSPIINMSNNKIGPMSLISVL